MSTIGGQGQVGSYLDYLNSLTGYNQPQGTFPAQSNGQATWDGAPLTTPQGYPAGSNGQAMAGAQPTAPPSPMGEPKKPSGAQQVASGLNTANNINTTYQQIASQQAAQQGAQQVSAQAATAVPSAAMPAAQVGASVPVSSQVAPAGMEATGEALGLSGDGVSGGMSVANSSAVPAAEAASSTPGFSIGSPSYAGYLGAANTTYGAGKNWGSWRDQGGNDYAATKMEQQLGLAAADVWTGGLTGMAVNKFAENNPKLFGKIDKFANKYGALGNIVRFFGVGDKDHRQRDHVRNQAQKSGWFDTDNFINLDDGKGNITKLNMDVDGQEKFTNAAGKERFGYDIDHEDPLAAQGIGWLQPIAALLGQGDEKMTSDFTGELYNQLTKDGDVKDLPALRAKVVQLYNHFKLKPSELGKLFTEMKDLPPEKRDAYLAAIDNLRPGKDTQIKAGEKAGVVTPKEEPKTDIKIGPKDNNTSTPKAMGDGAIKPRDPKVVMKNASR